MSFYRRHHFSMTSLIYQGWKWKQLMKIINHRDPFFLSLLWRRRQATRASHASHVWRLFHLDRLHQSYPAINPGSLLTAEAWNAHPKSFTASHLLSLCYTLAKFCTQRTQKRRRDPRGSVVSALPCQLLSQTFIPAQGCEIFLLNAYSDGVAVE